MQLYRHDTKFFEELNIINAYWAGFLAADGNIYRNIKRNGCRLSCTIKDHEHLVKFKDAIKATNPIKTYNKRINDQSYSYYHLNIDSAKSLCIDLTRNFNISERKSLILEPPSLNNVELIRAFIRGYFDGDGSIYRTKNAGFQISFVGTEAIIQWILDQFKLYITSEITGCIDKVKSITRLRFTGQKLPSTIMQWLYDKSYDSTRLNRKYSRFLEYSSMADLCRYKQLYTTEE